MNFRSSSFLLLQIMLTADNLSTLNGKVAVLTGASRGIGKAIADGLIANGAKVVIGDILDKEGQAVVDEYNQKYVNFFQGKKNSM